jgi:hypothetical protein
MSIIDPDGLFNGDRFRKCSNAARLYWPYFYLASNGYGRLEINYHRLVTGAFGTFDPKPSEAELLRYIAEYHAAHLLFLYKHQGQLWGAWDSPKQLLSKYQNAADKRSPAPPEAEFEAWKNSYKQEKEQVTENASSSSQVVTNLFAEFSASSPRNSDEISAKVPRNSPFGEGIGEGIGGGTGEGGGLPPAEPPQVTQAGTVEGLHEMEYGRSFWEQMGLPASNTLIHIAATSIAAHAKAHGISKAEAFDEISHLARDDHAVGQKVDRFWFEDGKYGPNRGKGISRNGQREQPLSATQARQQRNRAAILKGFGLAIDDCQDAGPGGVPHEPGVDTGSGPVLEGSTRAVSAGGH